MNKASRGDRILIEIFQILKDAAAKLMQSICQKIWKSQQWSQDWKRSVFIPTPKKGNGTECSSYQTIALISRTIKRKESEVIQSCSTLCHPMDCSLPGSSIHGIFQARILKWVVISFSRSSRTRPGLNPGLPHCRQTLYHLSHQGSAQNSPSQASTVHEPWTSRC